MKDVGRRTTATGLILVAATMVLAGCSESPKEKYQDAMEQVKEAKSDRQDAKKTLDKKKQALAEAREDVRGARTDYQQAQKAVDQASAHVDKVVSDELLFRTIQRKLVGKDQFDDSAISVAVKNRVVTLSGTVPSDDVRQQALKMTRDKPGVKKVIDSLKIQKKEQKQQQPAGQSGSGQSAESSDSGQSAESSGGQSADSNSASGGG